MSGLAAGVLRRNLNRLAIFIACYLTATIGQAGFLHLVRGKANVVASLFPKEVLWYTGRDGDRNGYPVDVRALLTDRSLLLSNFTFTSPPEGSMAEVPFPVFGLAGEPLVLDESVLDLHDKDGTPFNPAILRLPQGSRWEFIVVARGPIIWHKGYLSDGGDGAEQTVVGFGANMSSSSSLFPVSKARYLSLPQNNSLACGSYVFNFGPEDPRLHWSDTHTPMMIFGRSSTDPELCHTMALVYDLRRLWPELEDALREVTSLPSMDAANTEVPVSIELFKEGGQQTTEKNWVPFFPGPAPGSRRHPALHYSLEPPLALMPSLERSVPSSASLLYRQQFSPLPTVSNCITRNHPRFRADSFHHAAPLSRLTLCPRGLCEPDEHNTVLMAIVHINQNHEYRQYGRFVVTWNVTAPFNYISVGPQFHFGNTDDSQVVFVPGMVFLPSPFASPLGRHLDHALTPSHGFMDDDAFISLGLQDSGMNTVRVPVRLLLQGGRLCDEAQPVF